MQLSTILEITLGALIAIIITIVLERLRKPKLILKLGEGKLNLYQEPHIAQKAKFLYLLLHNERLPWYARWMSRDIAAQCHGYITFHHLNDGQNIFERSMTVRWSDTPEPGSNLLRLNITGDLNIQKGALYIMVPNDATEKVDVAPGETQRFDVAARFDNDDDCYGWSNENYFSEPKWRNPRWRLARGDI